MPKPSEQTVLFVTATPITGKAVKCFKEAYLPHCDTAYTVALSEDDCAKTIATRAPIVGDAVKSMDVDCVYALGSKAQAALEKAEVKSTYLPHPAVYLTEPARTEKKLVDTLHTSKVESPAESLTVPIQKASKSKQIVYSVVLDPYQFDAHGDHIPASEIEKAAHNWLTDSRIIGDRHEKWEGVKAQTVESHVVQYPTDADYQKAMSNEPHNAFEMPFGKDTVHSGAWIVGIQLGNDLWKEHLAGELDAVSIGGLGVRTPVDKSSLPEVEFVKLAE
jgi:hypothetical protein